MLHEHDLGVDGKVGPNTFRRLVAERDLEESDNFNNCIVELHHKKFPPSMKHKHEDFIKSVESHPNKKKFNLDYI